MVRHSVDHLAVGVGEVSVVLEKITVGVYVTDDELLVDHLIAAQKVRVARVVVDDHFVDLVQPVAVALPHVLVLHTEPPVRITRRESAVAGHHVDLFPVQHLEDDREEIEAIAAGVAFDLLDHRTQLFLVYHFPFPRKALIESYISSRPLISDNTRFSVSSKFARRSLMKAPLPYGLATWP